MVWSQPMSTAVLTHPPTELFDGVRMVVFDVVGTLVEPWPTVKRAYAVAGRRHGIELSEPMISRRFAAAWSRQEAIDAANRPAFATNREREMGRWRQIVEDVFEAVPQCEMIFHELWDHFGNPGSWRALPQGQLLLESAREAGCGIALASNFDERLLPLASAVEPLTFARHVFASSEVGWRKPAPEFFQAVATRLACAPGELLLVGDDPRLDLAAARAAGWRAVAVG